MPNDAILTVRIPIALKRRLALRASKGHRSLSGQVLHDLERIAAEAPAGPAAGRFVGLFAGSPVPTDAEIADVRATLWKRLSRPHA